MCGFPDEPPDVCTELTGVLKIFDAVITCLMNSDDLHHEMFLVKQTEAVTYFTRQSEGYSTLYGSSKRY